jgi:hypothetical protein
MGEREGPLVTIRRSCFDCAHVRSSYYAVQGDGGCDVSCAKAGRGIGDSTWTTPEWCPFLTPDAPAARRDETAPAPAPALSETPAAARSGCPRCGGSYATDKAGDGRPRFTCDGCRLVWTYGGDGGPYATQPGAGWCETGVRCAKCGSEYHATIETLPPLEVCQRCSEPWPTQAPAAPSGAGDAGHGSNEEG